jgi:hypothetical protein
MQHAQSRAEPSRNPLPAVPLAPAAPTCRRRPQSWQSQEVAGGASTVVAVPTAPCAGPPGPVNSLTGRALSSNTVQLSWQPPTAGCRVRCGSPRAGWASLWGDCALATGRAGAAGVCEGLLHLGVQPLQITAAWAEVLRRGECYEHDTSCPTVPSTPPFLRRPRSTLPLRLDCHPLGLLNAGSTPPNPPVPRAGPVLPPSRSYCLVEVFDVNQRSATSQPVRFRFKP